MNAQTKEGCSDFVADVIRDLVQWWTTRGAQNAPGLGFMCAPDVPHHRDIQQHMDELRCYINVLQNLQPRAVSLEIGLYRGATHFVWKRLFARAISIDCDYWTCCKAAIEFAGGGSAFVYGNSGDAETVRALEGVLGGCQLDHLFIDGDHRYESVLRDFTIYAPFVRCGGVVGFHDARLKDNGVIDFLRDLQTGRIQGWGQPPLNEIHFHPGDSAMGIAWFRKD